MDRRAILRSIGASLAAGAAGCVAGSGGGGTASPTDASTPTDTPDPGPVVSMNGSRGGSDFFFNPIGLHVEPGATVTFRIAAGVHSTTAYHPENGDPPRIPEAAEPWNSGTFGAGTFEHTFAVEGTYDYYCLPHRAFGMVGRIVVGDPGGPAEGDTPPDGTVPRSSRIVDETMVLESEL